MKMRDAFELHPELQATIEKIDPSFSKPNVLCKTMWNKLKDINNSNLPLITEGRRTVSLSIRKNKKGVVRTDSSNTFGSELDSAIADKLKKYKNVKRYELESIQSSSYNSDVIVSILIYCDLEESAASFEKRQNLLSLKKLFSKFICEEMKAYQKNADAIKKEKIALKKAFEEEMILLKQKYMQK